MSFEELLAKVAGILEKLKIEYFVTGGYAVSIWGRPRATFDIDVVVQLSINNIAPLARHLRRLSRAGYISEAAAEEAVKRGQEFNFIHPESGVKVDFWILKKNPFNIVQLKRRVPKKIMGQKIYFISPEDLILIKLLWHKESESSRQLEDVESILKISGKKLDRKYLKRWAAKLGVAGLLSKLLKI